MRLSIALLALLALPLAADAAIYRHVDNHGNVVYTDQPPEEGGEEVELPPLNQLPGGAASRPGAAKKPPAPPAAAPGPATPVPAAGPEGYQSLEIQGVEDGATLRDPTSGIYVSATVKPALRPGDRILLRHNGTETGSGGSFELQQLERGTHSFSAEIVDADGKVLLRAKDVTINVFRTTVRNQKAR